MLVAPVIIAVAALLIGGAVCVICKVGEKEGICKYDYNEEETDNDQAQ